MPSTGSQPSTRPQPATIGDVELGALRSNFLELRGHLNQAKSLLNHEIRSYPTPIPRCDAQFNELYEQRARLSQRLAGADAILEGEALAGGLVDSIAAYIDASPGCGDATEAAIVARLRAGIGGVDRNRARRHHDARRGP